LWLPRGQLAPMKRSGLSPASKLGHFAVCVIVLVATIALARYFGAMPSSAQDNPDSISPPVELKADATLPPTEPSLDQMDVPTAVDEQPTNPPEQPNHRSRRAFRTKLRPRSRLNPRQTQRVRPTERRRPVMIQRPSHHRTSLRSSVMRSRTAFHVSRPLAISMTPKVPEPVPTTPGLPRWISRVHMCNPRRLRWLGRSRSRLEAVGRSSCLCLRKSPLLGPINSSRPP
jgi:hypothetical protein